MAFGFKAKEWKARISEFATRRKLTIISQSAADMTVEVSRSEGLVSQPGDAFSPENMNDLERRVSDALTEADQRLGGLTFGEDESGKWVEGADSVRVPLGKLQRKLLGSISSSGTFDCTSISGWQKLTVDNFAVVPTNLSATGGHWLAAATGAGGQHSGSCTPSMSYDNKTGKLSLSGYYFNNDYSYGDHWTLYCRGQITANVYCYYI